MNVFITGGTGLIGKALIERFLLLGYTITILTRNEAKARLIFANTVKYKNSLDEFRSLDGYDIVVNLAGEPIVGRFWSDRQKKQLCDSRWNITHRLSQLLKGSTKPPCLFISGSAVGYYGAQDNIILTEDGKPHDEFLHRVCHQWEFLAQEASSVTRVCIVRTGIVLSPRGGMLAKMIFPFRYGLGSVVGSGEQYISWIHIKDLVEGLVYLIESPTSKGVFNFTSPNPETNKNFSKLLAKALCRPCIFRIPSFLIKLVMGEASTMLIDGQRVVPQKLIKTGYKFRYYNLEQAFKNLIEK